MTLIKSYLYFFLLLLFPVICFPQQPGSTNKISSSAIIKFIPGESPIYRNSNQMINVISEDAVKNLYKTEVIVNYSLDEQIIRSEGDIPVLSLIFENAGLTGDIHYRGFDITDILKPDRVNLSFLGGNKNDTSGSRYFEEKDVRWESGDSLLYSKELGPPGFKADTVKILQLQFFYDDNAFIRFNEHIQLIDDYFASCAVLDSLAVMAEKMRLNDISEYPLYFIHLQEIFKMITIIGNNHFPEKLLLEKYDPSGFGKKYQALFKYMKSAAMTFTENMNEAGMLNCPIPEDSLITEFIEGIRRYIRWSMLVNERNGRIYKEFLDTYYSRNAFGDDRGMVEKLLAEQHPGEDPEKLLKSLSVRLMDAFKKEAQKMIAQYQYSEAYELLRNAECLKTAVPGFFKDDDLEAIMARASGGIYASYLGIAGNALEQNKIKMAEIYLGKAKNYKNDHPGSLDEDSIYRKVFIDYFLVRIGECDLLAPDDPEGALQCLRQLEKDQDSTSLVLVRDQINVRIDRLTNLWHNDTQYRTKYAGELVHDIITNRSLIWMNRIMEARLYADSMELLVRKEGLNDSSLIAVIRNYRKTIEERLCWNLRESYELMMIRADRFTGQKDYLRAAAFLDSTLMITRQASGCGINDAPAKDTMNRYDGIIKYLKRQKLIENLVSEGNYNQAVIEYRSNISDFITNDLQRFGVDLQKMEEYAMSKNIPSFTFSAADYLFKICDLPGCVKFLRILSYQDFPVKKTKAIQKSLAKKLAEQDFLLFKKDEDPAVLSKKYSEGDNWFRSFDFWYMYRWNELRNK